MVNNKQLPFTADNGEGIAKKGLLAINSSLLLATLTSDSFILILSSKIVCVKKVHTCLLVYIHYIIHSNPSKEGFKHEKNYTLLKLNR